MEEKKDQFFSINNGAYFVKRTPKNGYYILNENDEWEFDPTLEDDFYEASTSCIEINEEYIEKIISEGKSIQR